jgi:seryl-tRNA synthetase
MDLEQEMQDLLHEENYLSELISQLSELKYRKGYDYCAKDIGKSLDELENKKEKIQEDIKDLTNNIIMAAEVNAGDYIVGGEQVESYI